MGTSASSNGPGSGISFDPPWLDDIPSPQLGDDSLPDVSSDDSDSGDQQPEESEQLEQPTPRSAEIAPQKRFLSASRALGSFIRTGNEDAFKRAVGHYSRTGMGGARNVANRMRTSTRVGANAFVFLQAARERTDTALNEWIDSLTSRDASAQEIADEIVKRTTPSGGSLDEASCQQSMAQAMEDLLSSDPDVDLFNLGDDSIWALTEAFLGYEAFNRLCLDIGKVFRNSKLSPRDQVTRMNEMQEYLKAEICAQVERLRIKTPHARSRELQVVLQTALQNTFTVYEGSI